MLQVSVPRDVAQADDDAQPGEQGDLLVEPACAVRQLGGRWLVLRRRAAADGGDPQVAQPHAVVAAARCGLRGEARLVEHGIKKVAGAVAGKGPSGAVGAVRARCEPEDEDAGGGIAEAGHGTAPIGLVAIGAAARAGHLGAPGAETRAALAGNDARRSARRSAGPGRTRIRRVRGRSNGLARQFQERRFEGTRHGWRTTDILEGASGYD